MRIRPLLVLVLLAGLPLAPGLLSGQAAPISRQLEIAPPAQAPWPSLRYHYLAPAAVNLGAAGFGAAWMTFFTTTDPRDYDRASDRVDGASLGANGRPAARFVASTDVFDPGGVSPPVLARIGPDRFVAVWDQPRDLGADLWFRRLMGPAGDPVDEQARVLGNIPDYRTDVSPAVAANGDGKFVIAWMRNVRDPEARASTWRPMAQVFDAFGDPLTDEVELSAAAAGENDARPAVGIDAGGNFMVLWIEPSPARRLVGRRFGAAGVALTERFVIGEMGPGGVVLAMAPSGGFVATWPARGPGGGVLRVVQRFGPFGRRVGLYATLPGHPKEAYEPAISRNHHGNVAVFWIEGRRAALALLDSALNRQGPVVYDGPATRRPGLQSSGGVALTDDGRVLTVWLGPRTRKAEPSILGRLWRARPF